MRDTTSSTSHCHIRGLLIQPAGTRLPTEETHPVDLRTKCRYSYKCLGNGRTRGVPRSKRCTISGAAPCNVDVFALLRECHGAFALLLFLAFIAHMPAVLFHTLVLRDRLLDRMALWRTKPSPGSQTDAETEIAV